MTFTTQDIDQIVAQVMAQLQPAPAAVSYPKKEAPATPKAERPAESAELAFEDAVITGDLLEAKLTNQKRIRVRPGAVLTPTAKDVLRVKKLELVRGTATAGTSQKAKWLAISSRVASSVPSVIEQLKEDRWEHRLSGTGTEATRQAVSAVCTAEAAGVVVLTGEPEVATCLANRNPRIRAATAHSVEAVQRIKKSLQPNLLAVDPAGRSFFELRNLLRAFSASVPSVPAGWME